MTEKDYHKIKKFNFDNLEYLKILLEINEKNLFFNKIKKLILIKKLIIFYKHL